MRKLMTKEVTTTTVTLAKMEMVEGKPVAVELPSEIIIGNVTLEKAQKIVNKKYGQSVTVFTVVADTQTYEMEVEQFIQLASIKVEQTELEL